MSHYSSKTIGGKGREGGREGRGEGKGGGHLFEGGRNLVPRVSCLGRRQERDPGNKVGSLQLSRTGREILETSAGSRYFSKLYGLIV